MPQKHMHVFSRSAVRLPRRSAQCRSVHALASISFAGTTRLTTPVSSSSVMNIRPEAVPGRWRNITRPATLTRLGPQRAYCAEVTTLRAAARAQQRQRMPAQREVHAAIVVDDLAAFVGAGSSSCASRALA